MHYDKALAEETSINSNTLQIHVSKRIAQSLTKEVKFVLYGEVISLNNYYSGTSL